MRLNAFIAHAGFSSRRKAADLIKDGKVKVGGKVVTEPWYVVKEGDAVMVGKKLLHAEKKFVFYSK